MCCNLSPAWGLRSYPFEGSPCSTAVRLHSRRCPPAFPAPPCPGAPALPQSGCPVCPCRGPTRPVQPPEGVCSQNRTRFAGCPTVGCVSRPCAADPTPRGAGSIAASFHSPPPVLAVARRLAAFAVIRSPPTPCPAFTGWLERGVSCGTGAGCCNDLGRPGLPGALQTEGATSVVRCLPRAPSALQWTDAALFQAARPAPARPCGSRCWLAFRSFRFFTPDLAEAPPCGEFSRHSEARTPG